MAYIGTPVQQALTKVTSQSFNGTGSQTVFTLNRAVNTGEELEVFVNNVQQEPGVGKSYTATGTTLTFDAAPSSGTGNVYVIYRGLAEVTRRLEHDPNAALAATTGTFSGGIDSNGNVNVGVTTADTSLNYISVTGGLAGSQLNAQMRFYGKSVSNTGATYETARISGGSTSPSYSLSGGLVFYTSENNGSNVLTLSERLRILSTGGITFNGDTTAANALDDYEEGSHVATVTPNTSGTITLSGAIETLAYTKVGRQVSITGYLNVQSVSSPVGAYVIVSLPFAIADLSDKGGDFGGAALVYDYSVGGFIAAPVSAAEGNSSLFVYYPVASTTGGTIFKFSFVYFTNA